MKNFLFILVTLATITVSAKKIDFGSAIEQSHQERLQTAEQIQDYLEVSKSHMQERKPAAEAKKDLFRGVQVGPIEIKEAVHVVADVK